MARQVKERNTGTDETSTGTHERQLSRRQLLVASVKGAVALGVTSFLAACGVGATATPSSATSAASTPSPATPGPAATTAQTRKKVAFLLPSSKEVRWQNADQKGFEAEAVRQNLDVIIQVANDDPTLQASQVDNVLTQGIDVLVLTAVNVDSARAMVAKAVAANVPVISYNELITQVKLAAFIGRDAKIVGQQIGEAALKAVPKGNYVLLKGDQSTSVAQNKTAGLMGALKASVDSGAIKIVADQWTPGWTAEIGRSITENALTANQNNIQAVCSVGDGMAYGAIEALKAQSLGGKTFVSGEDAEKAACKLINQGIMTVSIFAPFDQMGVAAAKAAAQAARGEAVTATETSNNGLMDVPWVTVLTIPVTKDYLPQFVKDYSWWVSAADIS
jgi:D-xylose transport system substrate-binding protein